MKLQLVRPVWLAAATVLMVSAALAGCSAATSTPTAAPALVPSAISHPAPTPTPVPELVLIAHEKLTWQTDLERWATQNGLKFTVADAAGASAYLRHSLPHVAAIVSVREALDGALQETARAGVPVVMVNVAGVEPGASLSTVSGARHDQAGFLAGVMAGLASQSGWVGQVSATGGADDQAYESGFTQGLLWGCPKCQLISQTAGELTVDRFRANAVDVVFIVPGTAAEEAARLLSRAGLPMVWVGASGPSGETLVGRLIFEGGPLVIPALDELMASGEGRGWLTSIESTTILIVDINAGLLSPGRQRLLEQAYGSVAAGELDIGTE